MTARGESTRNHLLDVAERLYGERGIAAVSLREIRIAAGARNTAAMQFHFGNRDGLLQALLERHMPRIADLQQDLHERIVAAGRAEDPRSLVEVLVRPSTEYLRRGASERAWVRIMADLASQPDLRLNDMVFVTPEAGLRAGTILFRQLERTLAPDLARERMVLVAQTSVHLCADYARLLDDPRSRHHVPPEVFTENLVDMLAAALFAPNGAPRGGDQAARAAHLHPRS